MQTPDSYTHDGKQMPLPTVAWEVMTRERVDELLAMNTRNRPPSFWTIAAYIRDLIAGRWILTHQGIAVSSDGVLIDGQQRLLAIKESGCYGTILLVTTGLHPDAQKYVDGQKKRTARDVFTLLCDVKVSGSVPAICRILYKQTANWIRGQVTHAEQWNVYEQYADEIDTATHVSEFWSRMPAPIQAAVVTALVVWPDRKEDIASFCWQVGSGAMLETGSPALTLRNYLTTGMKRARGDSDAKERYHKTFNAFHAHMRGASLSKLYESDRVGDALSLNRPSSPLTAQ